MSIVVKRIVCNECDGTGFGVNHFDPSETRLTLADDIGIKDTRLRNHKGKILNEYDTCSVCCGKKYIEIAVSK